MLSSRFYLVLSFLLSFAFSNTINAQLSKTHYLPPITSDELIDNQYIYISTPKRTNISFKIIPVGRPSSEIISGVVSNSNPFSTSSIAVDTQLYQSQFQTSSIIRDKGYLIEADDVVYVSVRMVSVPANNGARNQAAAIVSKGVSAKGTEFRMGGYANDNPRGGHLNFISVMATEDNTDVTFDNLSPGISIDNFSLTGTNFTINLDKGESYIVAVSNDLGGDPNHLLGTLIKSSKEIVVNSGSATGSFFGGSNTRDYGMDQIVGADKIGSEYIFVKGDGQNDWENILIVAHYNNTTIEVNGSTVTDNTNTPIVLNEGDWYVIEGNSYTSGNMYVTTSEKVFAYQGVGFGTNAANQGLFFVPPLSCDSKGDVDNISEIENIGSNTFDGGITIVTNDGAKIEINGLELNITNFTTDGPNKVDGIPASKSQYVTYKVTGLTGNINVTSDGELYCAYFNRNGAATSGSFYSGFLSAPEINFNTTVTSLGNCIPNVTLSAANTSLYDAGFKWEYFNDNTGNWEQRGLLNQNTYVPIESEPGRYRLVGKVICKPGQDFISTEIPVSICPDDFDGDLIIDNIDVDIDNDGILNCDESLGNININLTNINSASALNPLNNTNIINTSSYTTTEPTNSFIGDANGNFTSTVNSVTDTKYNLSFNQNINFVFKQNDSESHTVNSSEYFIIKIEPNNKNITLLDPDDQLLINTSYDLNQDFVNGVTNFSGSEIWFKYKADVNAGNSTFKFLANQVKEVTFEHKSTGVSITSIFNANIQLTCFSKDSDGDGVEDMFDLDSDNDGIPDFNESTAQDISLTKTDTNLDGLDNIFDTITPNQDTDNDGVSNYLDYDTDNDGIYDVVESGNGNLDADNNGIIDAASTLTVGNNGLFDVLETSPDSGVLKTPIRNSDNASLIVANRDTYFDFADLDADGDDCFDVIEAGFTGNGSGLLKATPFAVNDKGRVINNGDNGYKALNDDHYIVSAPIVITKFDSVTFCEDDNDEIEIQVNTDKLQWQISSDNGVTFSNISENQIINGTVFNNVTSKKLQLTNTSVRLTNYQLKVVLEKDGNDCGKTSNAITLTVNPKPTILSNFIILKQCSDNPLSTTINLTEAEKSITTQTDVRFEYFETEADAISGDSSKLIPDEKRYPIAVGVTKEAGVRIISTTTGCINIVKINSIASFAGNVTYDKIFEECDDLTDQNGNDSNADGITFFNFSAAEQEVINTFDPAIRSNIQVFFYETTDDRDAAINPIPNISNHRNNNNPLYAFNQTIYIKIKNKNNNDCEGIAKLFLKTSVVPEFSVEGEDANNPIIICAKNIPYPLKVNNTADSYDYIWTDKDGNTVGTNSETFLVSDAGEYTVTAFSRNTKICSRSRTIYVQKSNFETLNEDFITVKDDTSGISSNLSIQIDIPINPSINEEFQYALEDEQGKIIRAFQDNNIFNDIEGGVYNIIVENKNGCGTSELKISVIQFPKYFTPNNGDGKNDTWTVKGATKNFYQSTSNIHIFNRFGKLVANINIDGQGWNGTYNGKKLPADDYWYSIQLIPIDPNKKTILKKGNFSLLD